MSVHKSTDRNSDGNEYGSIECPFCGGEVEKWIDVYKVGNICVNCTQNMIRVIFENMIRYHNGKTVSLANIMQHGGPDYVYEHGTFALMFWLGERFPELVPEMEESYDIVMRKMSEQNKMYKKSKKLPALVNHGHEPKYCTICEKRVSKWIEVYPETSVYPDKTLCIYCAQNTMKTMLEDLVEYHNGVHVSLAEIFHGWPEKGVMKSGTEKEEQLVEKLDQKSREFFDFDTECEELHK